ncbi:phosphatidate cytidylyltransferase [Geminicoccaceae bacterium 1502E]|nr:phosphatidate cytidylyltransferase [Geminicoccaceae bacterium 1502E]
MARTAAERFDPALRQRILSALVLGAVALLALVLGGWAFDLLVGVAVLLMAAEWASLAAAAEPGAGHNLRAIVTAGGLVGVLAAAAGAGSAGLVLVCLAAVVAAGLAGAMRGLSVHWAAGGVLYVGVPAFCLIWLRLGETGLGAVLWLFLVVWSTDIAAYAAGRSIGGPKLAPRISPGKTWAGLVGGMAGAALAGGLASGLWDAAPAAAAAAGALLAVVAQAGDLFESFLKRRVGLKDSGSLIPGHGGILDRVDGLLTATPVFALILLASRFGAP